MSDAIPVQVGNVIENQYNQTYYGDDSGFVRLEVLEEDFSGVATPDSVRTLGEMLLERRLVVLGGLQLREKAYLARHIVWWINDSRRKADDTLDPLEGRQHQCGRGNLELAKALHNADGSTLFLVRDAEPHHLGHDLRRVLGWLHEGGHYLLVTTDGTRARWGVDSESPLQNHWCGLRTQQVYDEEYRAALLVQLVRSASGGAPPRELFPDGPPGTPKASLDRPLVAGLSLREVVAALETPEQIRMLADFLVTRHSLLTAENVVRQLRLIRADRSELGAWFQELAPRQQLFLTALTFFDGLFDDQLFGALDSVVENAWRQRQPLLEAFDYLDLESFERYVRGPRSTAGGELVEYRSAELRQAVLAVAWRRRRRELMVILPEISRWIRGSGGRAWSRRRRGQGGVEYSGESLHGSREVEEDEPVGEEPDVEDDERAVESVEGRTISRWRPYGPERELLGSKARRQRLYQVVSRSLAELGLLSSNAVERCLFELAAHGSWEAAAVSAQTFWSWRHTGCEPFLFQTLKSWLSDAQATEANRQTTDQAHRASPEAYVRITVALVVFYAALSEPLDELDERIVDLLDRLSRDRNPVVRARFRVQTLPTAVRWHLGQLQPLLLDLVADRDMIDPVAYGWSKALEVRPAVARPLLEEWLRRGRAAPPSVPAPPAGAREGRLATLARVYRLVRYGSPDAPVTSGEAAMALAEILNEGHPLVRSHAFDALGSLVRRFCLDLEATLRAVTAKVGVDERHQLIAPLMVFHRERLPAVVALHSASGVEALLETWLCDPDHPAAQQIALEALAVLETDESAALAHWWTDQRGAGVAGSARAVTAGLRPATAGGGLRMAPPIAEWFLKLVTAGRGSLRDLLRHPTGEMIHQLTVRPAQMRSLLASRRTAPPPLATVVRTLSRVATLYQNRAVLLAALLIFWAVGSLGFLFWLVLSLGGR